LRRSFEGFLSRSFEGAFWGGLLRGSFEEVFWGGLLRRSFEEVFWGGLLRVFWAGLLRRSFEGVFWGDPLRVAFWGGLCSFYWFRFVAPQGCTVGYCDKVCPTGAFTNDNRSVTFRGNKGPAGTGSNGNAGPISADTGLAIDPAAETYKKQIQVKKI
jgi:hypothetical protein